MEEELKVHGSIFFLLKKFVDKNYPSGTWNKLIEVSGATGIYEITASYPMSEIGMIVGTASNITGTSVHQLQENFGEYLVPDLFSLYSTYLQPEWGTFEVLLYTESVMHGAVRALNSTANPPVLNVSKVNNQLLMIDYYSKRRMGALAVGIIKGIAKYYKEDQDIIITSITNADAERVQIRIEFINRKEQALPV